MCLRNSSNVPQTDDEIWRIEKDRENQIVKTRKQSIQFNTFWNHRLRRRIYQFLQNSPRVVRSSNNLCIIMASAAASSLFSVTGKNVLVTGSSRGIGLMIAKGFVNAGANVILTSRSEEACKEAAASINCNHYVASNVSSREGCNRLVVSCEFVACALITTPLLLNFLLLWLIRTLSIHSLPPSYCTKNASRNMFRLFLTTNCTSLWIMLEHPGENHLKENLEKQIGD